MTGILLFVAFAFFAFAQAASARNGAQSAADAAALAAAQDSRDEMVEGLGEAITADEEWLDWLTRDGFERVGAGAGAAAGRLAAANDADVVQGPTPVEVNGSPGYSVEILTRYTVGDSIIPGTESRHARADAQAVIEPRCGADADAADGDAVRFRCDGGLDFTFDPEDFDVDDLPDPSVLFSVPLAS